MRADALGFALPNFTDIGDDMDGDEDDERYVRPSACGPTRPTSAARPDTDRSQQGSAAHMTRLDPCAMVSMAPNMHRSSTLPTLATVDSTYTAAANALPMLHE